MLNCAQCCPAIDFTRLLRRFTSWFALGLRQNLESRQARKFRLLRKTRNLYAVIIRSGASELLTSDVVGARVRTNTAYKIAIKAHFTLNAVTLSSS